MSGDDFLQVGHVGQVSPVVQVGHVGQVAQVLQVGHIGPVAQGRHVGHVGQVSHVGQVGHVGQGFVKKHVGFFIKTQGYSLTTVPNKGYVCNKQ